MDWQRFPEDTFAQLPVAQRIAETFRLHERAIEAATTGITISDCRLPDMPLTRTRGWHRLSATPRGGGDPTPGRIVAVADVFDALIHARPW